MRKHFIRKVEYVDSIMRGSRGRTECPDHPHSLKNHKNIVFSNSGPDPVKNHKAVKSAVNFGP